MAISINMSIGFIIFSALFGIFFPPVNAQAFAPAPAATSDGTTIDQLVACVLMVLALVLTYIIH